MDAIFSVLFILTLEGLMLLTASKKINIIIRKILLGLITVFYLLLISGFIILIFKADKLIIKGLFIFITVGILYVLYDLWKKFFKSNKELKSDL